MNFNTKKTKKLLVLLRLRINLRLVSWLMFSWKRHWKKKKRLVFTGLKSRPGQEAPIKIFKFSINDCPKSVTDLFTSCSFQRSAAQSRRVFKFPPGNRQKERSIRCVVIPCLNSVKVTRYFHFLQFILLFGFGIKKTRQEKS